MSSSHVPDRVGDWVKASRSASSSECVEMRRCGGLIEVRDSKAPGDPMLRFTRTGFRAWLDGAARGEFHHLTAD